MPTTPATTQPSPPDGASEVATLQRQLAALKTQLTSLQAQLQAQAPDVALVAALRAALEAK